MKNSDKDIKQKVAEYMKILGIYVPEEKPEADQKKEKPAADQKARRGQVK